MFEEANYTYEAMIKRPEGTKKAMIKSFNEEGLTVKCVASFLPHREVVNKEFKSFEELFEFEVSGFEPKVIEGTKSANGQIGIEEIMRFRPIVIK